MKTKAFLFAVVASASTVLTPPSATAQQILHGHVPEAVARLGLQPIGRLAGTNHLSLAIGLPLRNRESLANLLQQLYDPASTNYRHYLTPEQFTDKFGPTAEDYQAVIAFAQRSGFEVTATYPNRTLLDVRASVAGIEKTLHVRMNRYQHPMEQRTFFAPEGEPVLDLAVPVLHIAGLDDFVKPRPLSHIIKRSNQGMSGTAPGIGAAAPATGSGPGGTFIGNDFRAAYVPGATLTGSGQTVALFELDAGFYPSDITNYESQAGLPNVPVTPVLLDGYDGGPGSEEDNGEVSLDIEMAIAMAPGLEQVLVYEGSLPDDILNRIATDDAAMQISASWGYPIDATTDQTYQQFAAQGQSFFNASGDGDAWVGPITYGSCEDSNITIVGGTMLTTSGPGGSWVSESVWNWGSDPEWNPDGYAGSSGGISTDVSIPSWQQGIAMSANHGSTTMRNVPDVAMTAVNIYITYSDGAQAGPGFGTSCAAPLWAGFAALVNQQAAALGQTPVGFLNPALYSLGKSARYAAAFHDISTGNNTWDRSPTNFYAVPGYDLCTGWGTPNGINLIGALTSTDPLFISPSSGAAIGGAVGGPFNPNSQTFCLTNLGATSLFWSATSESPLLTVSPASGVLTGTSTTNVTVSLTLNANSLPLGFYSGSVVFSNLTLGTEQIRQFAVQAGLPPLTFDDLTGQNVAVPPGYGGLTWSNFYALNASDTNLTGLSGYQAGIVSAPMVAYNSGGNPASIIGPVPFDLLSAYLTAAWNDDLNVEVKGYVGTNLTYDRIIVLSAIAPTLINFDYFGVDQVDFISFGGTLHSGYTHAEPAEQFVMDNVTVVPHTTPAVAPLLQHLTQAGGIITFDWVAQMGYTYQVQYSTNLSQPNWINLGAPLTATNSILTVSDAHTNLQQYYRLLLLGSEPPEVIIFDENFDGGYTGAFGTSSYSGGSPTGCTNYVIASGGNPNGCWQETMTATTWSDWYGGQVQLMTVFGNTDTNPANYVLSFDAYGSQAANIQLFIQTWPGNDFGGSGPVINATVNDQLTAANTWQTFSVNLGSMTTASPTGATWQFGFQLSSWQWGGPGLIDTLKIDNIKLMHLAEQ